jgi:hypothetical protein
MITAMTTTAFDWRSFLTRWSEEWADAHDPEEPLSEGDEEARRTRWLGFAPATAEQVATLEDRLGRERPPSLRAFYQVSDGWRTQAASSTSSPAPPRPAGSRTASASPRCTRRT